MPYDTGSTDDQLLDGCRRGERLAQRRLYERYYGRNMSVCLRYAGNREEALEILNSAFLKVFQHIDRYQPSGTLAAWIARIVFNTAMDHIRSRRTYREQIRFPEKADAPVVSDPLDAMSGEEILRLLHQLPDTQRQIFSLYVIDGYRHKEIAELFGFDEATSRWHLAQARKQLRQLFPSRQAMTDPT
ncbi:MAG: sigma-70 family RNA polymerase sigma factor [Saprospiraceae bacterium]|nr:sigma-70 family RNA polymerase sigma factor [Saprospiraceae bacterium]